MCLFPYEIVLTNFFSIFLMFPYCGIQSLCQPVYIEFAVLDSGSFLLNVHGSNMSYLSQSTSLFTLR